MNFNFKDVSEQRGVSQFISPGVQVLKINNIVLERSRNTGSIKPVFFMESEPITDPNFKGVDGAKGRVGKVSGNGGYYLKDDNQQLEFISFLKTIAKFLGKTEEIEALPPSSFEDSVEGAKNVIAGQYARWFVAGQEYPKGGDKYGIKLVFPSRNFIESKDSSNLPTFDRTNPKHYKEIPKSTGEIAPGITPGRVSTGDDLPF